MAKYSAASGVSGAVSGASIGSNFGPIGTGVGAVVGGIAGLFGSKKKKKKAKPISTLDPKQQALYDDYIASLRGKGPFSAMYDFDAEGYNNVFDKTVARPAYRNFQENVIPGITGQFRGRNIMNSSYTGEALSRAGRDVQENLDAQRSANIFAGQQQANQNRMNGIQNVLGMQTFAMQKPKEGAPSTIDQILGTLAPKAGEWFADYLKGFGGGSPAAAPTAPVG